MPPAQAMLPGCEFALQEHDFISTPREVTEALLHYCPPPALPLIEPCAGGGAIVQALLEHGIPRRSIRAVEIRPEEREPLTDLLDTYQVHIGNWCLLKNEQWALDSGVLITNPPFSKLPNMLPHFFPFPYVGLLMPIEELAGKQSSHRALKRLGAPTDLIPIPYRVWPFVRGVSWFVWQEGKKGTTVHL